MANGWAQDGAVQEQIEDTVNDAVALARSRLPSGEAALECEDCGEDIPEARRAAIAGVKTCIACQTKRDRSPALALFNRRGSKDSQLR